MTAAPAPESAPPRPPLARTVAELIGFTFGVLLVALALNLFLVPNRIAGGGVSGLATVLYHLMGWPVGLTSALINIPLFIAGWRLLGLSFGVRSVLGFLLLAVFIDATAPYLKPLTQDPLLAAVFGGGVTGVGIGITYRYRGSTGGTVLAARLLYRLFGLNTGQALLLLDGLVILFAGIAFNVELALYAFVAVWVQTRAIDLVEEGQPYAKAAWIITDHPEPIGQRILHELDRGATLLEGVGMYTRQRRPVVLVTVNRSQIGQLKRIVREEDPRAFVIVTQASEVLGEGFEEEAG